MENKRIVEDWIDCFEQECSRHHIEENEKKVQILHLFVEESALEWYTATLTKIKISDWDGTGNDIFKRRMKIKAGVQ